MALSKLKPNLDRIGITASVLCAIHCAAIPFLLTMLPLWGLEFMADERVEMAMIGLSLVIGVWSLVGTYRKNHHKIAPVLILIAGFLLIGLGHFIGNQPLEPVLIPLGGLTIAAAHVLNLRLLKSCSIKHVHGPETGR